VEELKFKLFKKKQLDTIFSKMGMLKS